MTINSVIFYIGVAVSLAGLLLSLIVCILYLGRAASPQWCHLAWWGKYIYPLIVLIGPVLIMGVGVALMFAYGSVAYGSRSQVTYEDLVISSKIATGFSGCLWFGLVSSYFSGIGWAHTRVRGLVPRLGIKKKK